MELPRDFQWFAYTRYVQKTVNDRLIVSQWLIIF